MTRREYLRRRKRRDPLIAGMQFEMERLKLERASFVSALHCLRLATPPGPSETIHTLRHPLIALAMLIGYAICLLRKPFQK